MIKLCAKTYYSKSSKAFQFTLECLTFDAIERQIKIIEFSVVYIWPKRY